MKRHLIPGAALLLMGTLTVSAQGPIRIRVGTIVPKGSLWHDSLLGIGQEWKRVVGARLEMPIATLTDESDMVRRVRLGRLEAAGLSSVGLSRIDSGVSCLQVPMLLTSYEELDYVRDRVAPELERRIEGEGFKVLHWADGGWVYAFTKTPARTPADLRQRRLFTSAGDPDAEALYKDFGFNVVPLAMTDLIPMLQKDTVDAFAIVPLFAQLQDLFRLAPYMTDVKWTPLVGGTVISLEVWNRLPGEHQSTLLEAARQKGSGLRHEIRRLDEVAIKEMQNRGLHVVAVDDATERAWHTEAEKAYPKLRGRYCPADLFDTVVRLRDEYRRTRTMKPGAGAGR